MTMLKYGSVNETERALGAYENLVRATEVVSAVLRRQLDSFGLTMGSFEYWRRCSLRSDDSGCALRKTSY